MQWAADQCRCPPRGHRRPSRQPLWQRPVEHLELPGRIPLAPHLHPYLVLLQGPDDPVLELSFELARVEREQALADGLDGLGEAAHRIGGWLQSSLAPPEIGHQLARLMTLDTEADTSKTYLRLADRRVLALLRDVLGEPRVAQTLGRIQRWLYLDAQGRVATAPGSGSEAVPLRLRREEWKAMEHGEVLHRAIAHWLGEARGEAGAPLRMRPAQQLFAHLRKGLESAQDAASRWPHRFGTPRDLAVWICLAVLHPAFADHQAVHAVMRGGVSDTSSESVHQLRHTLLAALSEESMEASQ